MEITGEVQNGVIVLDHGTCLPNGTRVRIELLTGEAKDQGALTQGLLQWAGKGVGLPGDLARNHDHYLHGQPKK